MVFPILDTPRTEVGDQTRFSNIPDLEFSTVNSIPSPSKDSNDLLKQIRNMRGPSLTTPRARPPFGDRRNGPAKNEFTPLLKSAARNNILRSGGFDKENHRLRTPAGLKAGYGFDSPGLPLNSSIIMEEHTGSSTGAIEDSYMPKVPGVSSSAASTPMAVLPNRGDGTLENGRNLATLREQEARLEQIDKENFSLKLKIHFMEEALRKNGKDYNEAAIRENTELKVDKVTLQRDLKQNRKSLLQAQKDLEEYRKQFAEYAEKVKRRHANEGMQEELEQLKRAIIVKNSEIETLQQTLESAESQKDQIEKLQDEVADLEAELRAKDQELDEKDDELEKLHNDESSNEALEQQLRKVQQLLEETKEDKQGLEEALHSAASDSEKRLREKEQHLKVKDDELRRLEDQLKTFAKDRSQDQESRDKELVQKTCHIEELQSRLTKAQEAAKDIVSLREQLQIAEGKLEAEVRRNNRTIQDRDFDLQALRQKLDSAEYGDHETEKLQDSIADLEAELREQERLVEDKESEIHELKERLENAERQAQEQLEQARVRAQELQGLQSRNVAELQSLRDADKSASNGYRRELDAALARVEELEDDMRDSEKRQKQLQDDVNKLLGQQRDLRTKLEDKEAECDRLQQEIRTRNSSLEQERASGDKQIKELNEEMHILHDHLDSVEAKLQQQTADHSASQEQWESQRRALDSQKTKAEEQSKGLQSTLERIQEAESSLSGRELQLQRAFDSEKKRFESEEAVLQKELREVIAESERRRRAWEETKVELSQTKRELQGSKDEINNLQEKIQGLDDEIEVLQSSLDDEAERFKGDLHVTQEKSDDLQGALAKKTSELNEVKTELQDLRSLRIDSPQLADTPSPQRELRKKVSDLNEQLSQVKKDRQDLQSQLHRTEAAHNEAMADLDTLQFDLQATSGSRQQRLHDLQSHVSKLKKENQDLQDSLAATNADVCVLQSSISELKASRDTAQQQARELRIQLQTLQREQDRKHQSQVALYEQDLQNLEQDLADAAAKHDALAETNESAERQTSRLKSKIQDLETRLASARNSRPDHVTSAEERKDLHEMLKDAKIEAEDLAMQIRERDSRIESAVAKETQLRAQLNRLRDERTTQTSRADAASKDLERVQATHDHLVGEMSELRALQRRVRFHGKSSVINSTLVAPEELERQAKRHAAELRGLVKQIEYLGARCHREESFRRDLGYVKTYFTKQIEMYGRCTAADLQLVKALGIPTEAVGEEQREEAKLSGPGRVVLSNERGSRPSLRVVGLMVLAGVKMGRKAEDWRGVREGHEVLLKKLQGMRKGRVVSEGKEGKESAPLRGLRKKSSGKVGGDVR